MTEKIIIKSVPIVIGIDDLGRNIEADEWHGEVYAELKGGNLSRVSLRCKNNVMDIVDAINIGLEHVLKYGEKGIDDKGEADK